MAEFVKTFLAPELASAYANDEPKEGPMTDKRIMKAGTQNDVFFFLCDFGWIKLDDVFFFLLRLA